MSLNRTIHMSLNTSSINQAIREVRQYRKELTDCCQELMRVLVEQGVTVAKMNVMSMNAVYTGALEESIRGVYFPSERLGVVFTDVPYALYVEYGTGIVGDGNRHPEYEAIEWEYDINHHGEAGWWYFADIDGNKRFRWTKGMKARPYMYNTLIWLRENLPGIAQEVMSKA